MKKIFIKIIFLISLLIVGCTKTKEKGVLNAFKSTNVVDIHSEQILIKEPSTFFSDIYSLKFSNNLLFIEDPETEYLFKIVDLTTASIKKFGKRGKGPNELIGNDYDYSFDHINKQLYIRNQFKLYTYDVDSLMNSNVFPTRIIEMKSINDSFVKSVYCNNDYIMGSMFKKRFGIFNISNNSFIDKYNYEVGPLVNQGFYLNNPKNNKVAFFQTKFTALAILTVKEGDFQIKETIWRKSKDRNLVKGNIITTQPDPNPHLSFISGAASENYIYGLYSGKPLTRENYIEASKTHLIFVFDWNGNPIKRYKLDKEVSTIAVDNKDNFLYAGSDKDMIPILLRYKLK